MQQAILTFEKDGAMSRPKTLKQPKALYLLAFVQIWEAFSYYGMRSILVLFMTQHFGYSDSRAYAVFTIYIVLVEFGGIIGGYIADKFLGMKYALYLGSVVIALGHLCMSFGHDAPLYFYCGLSLIVLGSALFKANCFALLGEFYANDDPRSQSGMTILYTSINIGAFFATIACGYIASVFGWDYGFGLATIGMMIGLIGFYSFNFVLEDKGKSKHLGRVGISFTSFLYLCMAPLIALVIYYQDTFLHLLWIMPVAMLIFLVYALKDTTKAEKKGVYYIIFPAIILLGIFYAFEEQISSTFILFIDRCVKRTIFGFDIPASSITAVSPCVIIVFGLIIAKIFMKQQMRDGSTTYGAFIKIGYAFAIIASAYWVLVFGISLLEGEEKVSIYYPITTFSLIAIGELFLAPAVYDLCIKLAPNGLRGMMIGMVSLGYALSGIISGYISKFMAIEESETVATVKMSAFIANYNSGFLIIAIVASIVFISIMLILKGKSKRAKE